MAYDVSRHGHGLPNTRWSEVEFAKNPGNPGGLRALDAILTRYREAAVAHLQAKFHLSLEDAEDVLHSFVEKKILEQDLMQRAEPSQGRFRTFFLQSLNHFAISEIRRQLALKRRPRCGVDSLHNLDDHQHPAAPAGEEKSFDVVWSRVVISGAALNMYNECARMGRAAIWDIFAERILGPAMSETELTSYEELVLRHGLQSPSEAWHLTAAAKRIFRRHLSVVVAEYATSGAEIEEELVLLTRLCNRRKELD